MSTILEHFKIFERAKVIFKVEPLKILNLTLDQYDFDEILQCRINFDIRDQGHWIESRLFHKNGLAKKYHLIKFTNGVGKNRPYLIVEFKSAELKKVAMDGIDRFLHLKGQLKSKWVIKFGEIVESGNL